MKTTKPKPGVEKTRSLLVRGVSPDLHAELAAMATEHRRPVSRELLTIIEDAVRKHRAAKKK